MPISESTALSYIELGYHLRALMWTSSTECQYVISDIRKAIQQLDALGFTYPRNQLQSMATKLEEVATDAGSRNKTPENISSQLRGIVECINDTIKTQADARRLIHLQSDLVSAKLRELPANGSLNTRQTYLFDETVKSLERGAYRSAVVMGWNLAFDIIREWIFCGTTRLADFNAALAAIVNRTGVAVFNPIDTYDDFFDVGERVVLDMRRSANLIGGNTHDDLRGHLRQRNKYAHASDFHPTVNQANALIDHLIDALSQVTR